MSHASPSLGYDVLLTLARLCRDEASASDDRHDEQCVSEGDDVLLTLARLRRDEFGVASTEFDRIRRSFDWIRPNSA